MTSWYGRVASLRVHILAALFGSSSWLSVNSVFMEMPLMVPSLPERWQLPSYLALIAQLAIVGPLFYGVLKKCVFKRIDPAPIIVFSLSAAIVFTALLALFWDTVDDIGGNQVFQLT